MADISKITAIDGTTYDIKDAVARQSKANDNSVVHNTGAENVSGEKTFKNDIFVNTNSRLRYLYFKQNDSPNGVSAAIRCDSGNSEIQSSNRLALIEYSPTSVEGTANTGYFESYLLPEPTKGLSSNTSYDILTDKQAVTVAQGGTGATDASTARTNLGLGDAATMFVRNGLTETTSGFVLDARQGKTLNDTKLGYVQLSSVAANGSKNYTVNNTGKYFIIGVGASTSKNAWIVNVASGTPSVMALGTSSALSMTTASNKLTITNSGGNGAQVYALILSGTIEDAT